MSNIFTENVKVQKQTKDGTYSMTIPKRFANTLNIDYGDTVKVTVEPNDNRLIVSPMEK